MKNYAYLILVNANANNNKYYEIIENDNGEVSVKYGRVGVTTMTKDYGYSKTFYGLKEAKEREGYEDRTALHSVQQSENKSVKEELSYKPVEDENVQNVLDLLIKSSREFVQKNYTISATEITQKMLDEAQYDIDELNRIAIDDAPDALYEFNRKLQELFCDIPRRMSNVKENLATTKDDFVEIINREVKMLANLTGIVPAEIKARSDTAKDQTALEANGLTMRPVTYKEEDQILSHLGYDYDGREVENRYVQAFAVENKSTRAAYEAYKKEHQITNRGVRLFYHGSKVENFYSIVKTGLSLNPKATITGKMFGQGLYFAPETRKALNYMDTKGSHWNDGTRNTGFCAVYAVAIGKPYEPNRVLGSDFRGKDLPKGTDSVFASKHNPKLGLRNDEYIVYDQAACTIKYLMEMSKQDVRTKTYSFDRNTIRDNLSDGFDTLKKIPQGVRAKLDVTKLSSEVRDEITSKITDYSPYDELFVEYNAKTNRIAFCIVDEIGESFEIHPAITVDDYAFFSREMKKVFVESEKEWKTLMDIANDYPLGKTVADKDGILPYDDKQHIKEAGKVRE